MEEDDNTADDSADAEDPGYPPIRDEDKRSLRCRDGAFLPIVVYDTKSGMTALISLFKNGQPIKEPHEGGRDSWRVFEKTIGQGNYGDVAIVINVRRGRRSEALKSVRLQGKTEAERRAEQSNLIDEARNMLRVGGHTNVLQVLGVFLWSNEVLTFSELVDNGRELTDIIQGGELVARAAADDDVAAAERAALQRVLTLALQLARGLGHIHSRCVLHNDVRVVVAAARPANGGGGGFLRGGVQTTTTTTETAARRGGLSLLELWCLGMIARPRDAVTTDALAAGGRPRVLFPCGSHIRSSPRTAW